MFTSSARSVAQYGTSRFCAEAGGAAVTRTRAARERSRRIDRLLPRANRTLQPASMRSRPHRARHQQSEFCTMRGVSVPGENAVDELLHRRGEVVRIERVVLEAERGMAGKHQVLVDRTAVGDVLQRLLDAEAARIGKTTRGVVVMVLP